MSRSPRRSRLAVREELGIGRAEKMVLVTMGGIRWRFGDLDLQEGLPRRIRPVIPGATEGRSTQGPAVLLPHRSGFHHADLVHAADAVVGKLGYSTVAEVVHAGVPFAYLERPRFRESAVLARFVQGCVPCLRLEAGELEGGRWLRRLPELVALARTSTPVDNGAAAAAALIEGGLAPP